MTENIFKVNDLSNIKLEKINGIEIYHMDNFYKYPDKVYNYIFSLPSSLHKNEEKISYNNIYFEDRRHFFIDKRLSEPISYLSKAINKKPQYPDTLITNLTRFLDHPFNDFENCFWWPHIDSQYNAIIYLNKDVIEDNSGTAIYEKVNNYIPNLGEHGEPWQKKENWKKVIDIKAKYNRMVMFNGQHYHAMSISDKQFFGKTLYDAKFRINQVIFF